MSHVYVPVRTERAAAISAALFDLHMPPAVRDARDAGLPPELQDPTRYYCDWQPHPSMDGWSVLIIPEGEGLNIHSKADLASLEKVLGDYVTDGRVPRAEVDALKTEVTALKGQPKRATELVPATMRAAAMDRAAAKAAGYVVADVAVEEEP